MPEKNIQAARGVKDILPEEQKYWFWVERTWQEVVHASGFERIILPTFEPTELFKRSVGEFTDIVSKQMYTFKDLGNNSITLRPEGTAGTVRAYLEHGMRTLPQPVKLYYWGPMYRYERPQAGRFREFYQVGLEMFGDDTPMADVSMIQSILRFYKKLGLSDIVVKVNTLGTVRSRTKAMATLSKMLGKNKKNLCEDCKIRAKKNPLRVLDCKTIKCQEIIAEAGNILMDSLDKESKRRFTKVLEHMDELKLEYELDPGLVRGLDYYTHTVFEIVIRGNEETVLGGGGRYDDLVKTLGGPSTPAIGFAVGVERVINTMKAQSVTIPEIPKADVFIVQLGNRAKDKAQNVMTKLEEEDLKVASLIGKKGSIQGQLKLASQLHVPLAIIIGDQEIHDKNIILRDMQDRSQETVIDRKIVAMVKQKLEEKKIEV
ncbi:MAG: histidine--tRNA ligase [Patescibacteria group bacterium]|nr:histidine--tRNA ligase [Patescibacteria group bacterium]